MKRWIHTSINGLNPYPDKSQIDRLEAATSDSSVEDAYYTECIDAIAEGVGGHQYESDSAGLTIYDYDETGEPYDIATISNDYIKELEIDSLRESNNWQEFHEALSSRIEGFC